MTLTPRRPAALTAAVAVARNAPLVRLQLSWAAAVIASWTGTVTVSVVAFAEAGTGAVAAAVLARTLPGVVFGPLAGALVDRVGARASLAGAAIAGAVVTAGAAVASRSLAAVVVLVALLGLTTMLFRAAQSAIAPQLVREPAELTATNVVSSAVEALGVFAGPALAGLLLAVSGPGAALAVAAGLLAAASGLALALPGGSRGARSDGDAGSLRALLALRPARLLLLLLCAQTVVSGGLVVLYPALTVEALGVELSAVGALSAAFGLGGVVASVAVFALAGSARLGRWTVVGLALWSLPLLLVPLAPQLPAVLALLAVVGAGNVLFDVTTVTLLQRAVPARLLGRAFGAVEAVVVVGLSLGAVLAPVLVRLVGAGPGVAVLAAPLVLVAVAAVLPLHRLDRDLEPPARQVALLRSLPAFALLPPVEAERLALAMQRIELQAGEVVVRQGEPGRTWFVVDSGELEVTVDGKHLPPLRPGEAFGEVALLRGGVRTATVRAGSPATVWALDGQVFLAALRGGDGRALEALDAVADERLARAAPGGRRR